MLSNPIKVTKLGASVAEKLENQRPGNDRTEKGRRLGTARIKNNVTPGCRQA